MLTKLTVETAPNAELTDHLGHGKNASKSGSNTRNSYSSKAVLCDDGKIELNTPHDRENTFEPQLIKKHQTRITQVDSQILSLYVKSMTTREIVAMFREMCDAGILPTLISKVTDAAKERVPKWQNRPLDALYPIVYLDCIVVKVRHGGSVINKAVFLALGINTDGQKELLGMWLTENEGAKFWLGVLTELKDRDPQDILIACVDDLKGFPEAMNSVYPQTYIRPCIIHMVRNSLKFVSWKGYKAVTSGLRAVYQAPTEEAALMALDKFADVWDEKYPQISESWRTHWENLNTFFGYPPDIRRVIYTTNTIELLSSVIQQVIEKRKVFPADDSVRKMIYLAIQSVSKKWGMPIQNWWLATSRFITKFGNRLSEHL